MSNNKQITKNTIILYLRMIVSMLFSLYTSRVVLRELGVVDFGINNIVSGLAVIFLFLNDSISGATSRFLTYYLGKNDSVNLKKNFGASKTIHLFIAIIVILLSETIGLYLLRHKLMIPQDRMFAANCIFQLCVIGSFITITQVPYTACIFSREKMTFYAVIELIRSFLQLASVFILNLGDDKLIFWGVLNLIINVVLSIFYRVYCWVNFEECRSSFVFTQQIVKPMLTFSGWDLYGNLSVMARSQGVNVLLNIFFGPLMNAASGIAVSIQNAVMSLSNNLVMAMRPQIVKRYANNETESMLVLLNDVSKLSFLLISFLTIPLIVEIDYILSLWLGNVPEYAAQISIYVLMFNIFANQSVILISVIHATGKIFRSSFINGSLYLLVIPISYMAYKFGGAYWIAFFVNVIAVFCGMLSNAWTIHLYIPKFSFKRYIVSNLLPCIMTFSMTIGVALIIHLTFEKNIIRFILNIIIPSMVLCVIGYKLLLSIDMQQEIYRKIKHVLCRIS